MKNNLIEIKNKILLELAENILDTLNNEKVDARVLGGIGIYLNCPDYQKYFFQYREPFSDIDLVVRKNSIEKVERIFNKLGLEEDKNFKIHFGYQRRIFYTSENITIEIYLENLNFCQEVKIGNRLFLSYPTLSTTDLFLSKIQKIGLSSKDRFDLSVLLLQHRFSNIEDGNINLNYIAQLCANNWNWWKTLKVNIMELRKKDYSSFHEINGFDEKLTKLEYEIDLVKKSFLWKLRNLIGEKISWYSHVE